VSSSAPTLFITLLSFFTVQLPNHVLASIFKLALLVALAALLSWLFIFTASLRAEFKTKFMIGLNALCNKTLSF
jgi:hypothetical protein